MTHSLYSIVLDLIAKMSVLYFINFILYDFGARAYEWYCDNVKGLTNTPKWFIGVATLSA